MDENHILIAGYDPGGHSVARPANPERNGPYQYDYGQILRLEGFNGLPHTFEMHFGTGNNESVTMLGQDGDVLIPDQCLMKHGTITAWLYLHDTSSDGETRYVVEMRVKPRSKITNQEPTPVQQDTIAQAIAALNGGVAAAEEAQRGAEAAQEGAEAAAESIMNAGADAQTLGAGVPATASVTNEDGIITFHIGVPKGDTGEAPIDDTAGAGDTDVVWSADKSHAVTSVKADKTDTVLNTTLSRGRLAGGSVGDGSIAFGNGNAAGGRFSQAFGESAMATGNYSSAEGYRTTVSGAAGHGEGNETIVTGEAGHGEGAGTYVSGAAAHAENEYTSATGNASHAQGSGTTAVGYASDASGLNTVARGSQSAAEGESTIAQGTNQHVSGRYNVADTSQGGQYAAIVGNGTNDSNRSNAFALGWNGDARFAGDVYAGCEDDSTGGNKLAKVSQIPDISGKLDKPVVTGASGQVLTSNGSGGHSWQNPTDIRGKADKTDTVLETTLSRGRKTNTTVGNQSFAFGNQVEASGARSHAEGLGTIASGTDSHSEGASTQATGERSHAEGYYTVASGRKSHAENDTTTAIGDGSHSEGLGTIANAEHMHVQGHYNAEAVLYPEWTQYTEYNVGDKVLIGGHGHECITAHTSGSTVHDSYFERLQHNSDAAFVIGNGKDDQHRSNAVKIDWNGNEELAGDLKINAGGNNELSVTELAGDVSSVKSALNDIIITEETVSPTITTVDGYMNANGTVSPDSGGSWKCANYIDISDAKNHVVNIKSCIYGSAGTVWFAEDESVIGYITGANASDYGLVSKSDPQTYSLTLPDTAKYIRATWYKASYYDPVDLQVSYSVDAKAPGEYLEELLNEKVDADQGVENTGKILSVGANGKVIPVQTDTTLLQSGKAADAKTTGDAIREIDNTIDELIGIPGGTVDADITVVDGTMLLKGGSQVTTATWECSDYIDVSDAYNHQVSITSTVYGYAATVWYDSSKTKINGFDGYNSSDYGITASNAWQTYVITLPENAVYLRISGYKETKPSSGSLAVSYQEEPTPGTLDTRLAEKVDIEQGVENANKVLTVNSSGNVVPTASPWGSDLATKADKAEVDVIKSIVGNPQYTNLINPSTIVDNSYIIGATGIRGESTGFKSSDYVLLESGKTYYVGGFYFGSAVYYAFYSDRSESAFISNPDATVTSDSNSHAIVVVGESDIYARFSALKTVTNQYISSYVDYYVPYSGPITMQEMVTPKCRFRKVLVLGDSISTDNYGDYKKWVTDLIDEGFLPADTVNSSQHASGFVARYNDQPNDFITRLTGISNPETYDLVITFGGINDANKLVPMGTDSDTDYLTYFGAAVRYYYKYLCTNFINARIATLLPLPCSTQNRESSVIGVQYTYSDYQKSVCEAYSLPVLDLTNHSGFYPDANKPGIDYYAAQAFRNRWTLQVGEWEPDGIHPTEEYEKKFLAPMIKSFIETL